MIKAIRCLRDAEDVLSCYAHDIGFKYHSGYWFVKEALEDLENDYKIKKEELRDQFAGQALAGICYKASWDDGEENVVAGWAYALADAMLAEREKEAQP
jgi:hypothetical protein